MEDNRVPFGIADLILKSFSQALNPQEQQILDDWLAADAQNATLLALLKEEQELEPDLAFISSLNTEKAWQKVAAQTSHPAREINLWQRLGVWKYAAVVVLVLGIALVFAPVKQQKITPRLTAGKSKSVKIEINPVPEKAKLALADGTEIFLDDIADGTVRMENGLTVEKQEGQVVFRVTGNSAGQPEMAYNTISTPIGGQYQVVLPDGSKVWLNSASALRFPTSFSGGERAVTLAGEGYFEIAKNKNKPFRVTANHTIIEVLGTHFNVMAYPDESATKATLLEGSVKVSNGKASKVIKPGQQANITEKINLITVDLEEAVAWKNRLFHFNETDLPTIARELERWYEVDISFNGQVPDRHFTGVISRQAPIEKVLKMLSLSGNIEYEIKERRILLSAKKAK